MRECHGNEITKNGHINMGIMYVYVEDNFDLSASELYVFMRIVSLSFGYERKDTENVTVADLAKTLGLSNTTVVNAIKELVDIGLITKRKENSFGSTPYSYSPTLPTFAKIHLKEEDKIKKDNLSWFKNLIK